MTIESQTAQPGPGRGNYDRSCTKKERYDERHVRLLRAAAEVFAAEGFSGANLTKIIKQAGVGRKTFYEHFDDMHHCLVSVYEYAIGVVFRDVGAQLSKIDDPIERLERGIADYLAIIARNGALAQVVTRDILGVARQYATRRDAAHSLYAMMILGGATQAYALGRLSREPDELTCFGLVGAIESVAMRYIDRGEHERIEEAAPVLAELVLRAFGGDPDLKSTD